MDDTLPSRELPAPGDEARLSAARLPWFEPPLDRAAGQGDIMRSALLSKPDDGFHINAEILRRVFVAKPKLVEPGIEILRRHIGFSCIKVRLPRSGRASQVSQELQRFQTTHARCHAAETAGRTTHPVKNDAVVYYLNS
ncbi:hypothetical protein [Consotaella salsifontis]|uniref:hypothetical protein n=1 Tax=Consotaella salsifontis TaxID=1365950 RepID=UPI0010563AB9|nr:hypothetical protein [Consotaella salsifontis]